MGMVVFKVLLGQKTELFIKRVRSWVDLHLLLQVESGKFVDAKCKRSNSRKSAKSFVLLIQNCLFIFVSVCLCHGAPKAVWSWVSF